MSPSERADLFADGTWERLDNRVQLALTRRDHRARMRVFSDEKHYIESVGKWATDEEGRILVDAGASHLRLEVDAIWSDWYLMPIPAESAKFLDTYKQAEEK